MLMADFGALPPEINSARMYAGPGSGPLLAAAAAWDALAAQLESFTTGYSSTLAELQGQSWSGPASSAMAAAAAPYVAWASTTAVQAAETASQAHAAAAAYEAAFAATVPPPVVAANRALLALLVVTNFFGQNTPAIAATEATYAEMWAQDAAAMYGYAESASAAAALASFNPPPQTTNPAGQPAQGAAVSQAVNAAAGNSQTTLSQAMSAAPLSGAAQPGASTTATATAIIDVIAPLTAFNYALNTTILGFEIPKTLFQGGSYFLAEQRTRTDNSDLPVTPPAPKGGGVTAQTRSSAKPFEPAFASMGRAVPVGGMSVPQGWDSASPTTGAVTEPAATTCRDFRALPTWTGDHTTESAGMPAAGRIPASSGRRQTNAVFRRRDRRYRIPRPPVGG
jgi:PPE-repeat protein